MIERKGAGFLNRGLREGLGGKRHRNQRGRTEQL
jgi:hypothetical protein